jgi:iron complex outermembrane receptor protein
MRFIRSLLPVAIAAAGLGGPLHSTTALGQAASGGIEEVTVTARKKEESLQDAPISISAFSGEGLEQRGVTSLAEIENFTPSMTFQNNPSFSGASSSASIYLRGIGQKEFLPTVDPGVGLYVDGIYVARSVGAVLDLVEIERVEVLRGPQGTLFGRNTIGGAVSVVTRKPDEVLAGNVQATVGSDQRRDIKGTVNLPLGDTLYSRISVASLRRDGYVERVADGEELGDDDTLTGRLALRWLPSDAVTVDWNIDHTRDRENGPAVVLLGINYAGPVDPDTPPMATIHNVGANLAAGGPPIPCLIPPLTGLVNNAVPGCYDNRYVLGKDKNAGTAPSYSKSDLTTSALSVEWEISDSLTLRSLTGWRDLDSEMSRDGDGSPFRVAQFADDLQQQQLSQEFQLLGSVLDDRLDWILGAYYFEEDGDNANTLDFTVSNFLSGGEFDNESTAFFAQGSYQITDALSLTLGMRYTDETKKFLPDQYILQNYFAGSGHPLLDAPFMQAGVRILPYLEKDTQVDETTPMANLRWQVSDDLMTYVTYSEGFKSGGFSQRVFPPQVAGITAPPGTSDIDLIPSFDPEFVESWELGFKYANADNTFRLNGALFTTQYDDFQIQVFTSVAPVTKNAASVETSGGELELAWAPAEGWLLEAGVGYVDAQYEKLDSVETLIDKSYALERVPELTANAALSKRFDLGDNGRIDARVDWSYRDDQYMDSFNTPQIAQGSYDLFNASLTWTSAREDWSVMLGGTNLSDEDYLISGIIGDAFQAYEGVYARGREYYLTLRYNFGAE